jgi:hypothetical protein
MSGFYIPSYLDKSDGTSNFVALANSFTRNGPIRIKDMSSGEGPIEYTINTSDIDVALRATDTAVVFVPADEFGDENFPIGAQVAVINYSEKRVLVEPASPNIVIGCPERRSIEPWRIGVLMKQNANFWLLSLGSGASGGPSVPTAPTLKTTVAGNKQVTLTWTAPADDGGSPVTGYYVEYSLDQKEWTPGPATDASKLTATVMGLSAVVTYFRVTANNENGKGEPSNVLSATPLLPAPDVTHVGNGQFQIVGFDKANTYKVTANAGNASVNATGLITSDNTNCVITLTYSFGTSTSNPLYLQRRKYEYHTEQSCTPVCRYAGWNCFHCDGDCVGCQ